MNPSPDSPEPPPVLPQSIGAEPPDSRDDAGQIVRAPRIHRIWAWIFPTLAAAAGLWILWSNWTSQGPTIEILFTEAPGIQSGKSVLVYRGVTSGHVTRVTLNPDLGSVSVTVRLTAFAAALASQTSDFWIDKPVISVRETSGLEAIIQGNSIHARLGSGPATTRFIGLSQPPVMPLDDPSLEILLTASEIPFLGRGTPVYHRGIPVGSVGEKAIDAAGNPFLRVLIDEDYQGIVRTTSRFWILPATSLKLSARGASLDLPGLDALTEGGITFDDFSGKGEPVTDGARFPLATHETAARMDGPQVELTIADARGIFAGETLINCYGYPVGLVESVSLEASSGGITAKARMDSRFAHLATTGSTFSLVQPLISLNGVSGLDTILTGAYIALDPGQGEPASRFAVRPASIAEWERAGAEREGLTVSISASNLPPLQVDAPVFHRGLVAGRVLETIPGPDGRPTLNIVIRKEFKASLTTASRFWQIPAFAASAGPGVLDLDVGSLDTLLRGGLRFENFGSSPAPQAASGQPYQLFESEASARAISPAIRIKLENGQGLLAGKTQLRRMGVPVGLVDKIDIHTDHVEVTARFDSGHDDLRREGARFAIVQPRVSLHGLTGIETMLSGVYIDCVPGSGPFATSFEAPSTATPAIIEEESRGFNVTLTSPQSGIRPGAPVLYRQLVVGKITEKTLAPDNRTVVLTASIEPQYSDLVRTNSVFWDDSAVHARVAFIDIRISGQTILAPDGRVAFGTPPGPGEPAAAGQSFPLAKRPLRQR